MTDEKRSDAQGFGKKATEWVLLGALSPPLQPVEGAREQNVGFSLGETVDRMTG